MTAIAMEAHVSGEPTPACADDDVPDRPGCSQGGPALYADEALEYFKLQQRGWDPDVIAQRRGLCPASLRFAWYGVRPSGCGGGCVVEPLNLCSRCVAPNAPCDAESCAGPYLADGSPL